MKVGNLINSRSFFFNTSEIIEIKVEIAGMIKVIALAHIPDDVELKFSSRGERGEQIMECRKLETIYLYIQNIELLPLRHLLFFKLIILPRTARDPTRFHPPSGQEFIHKIQRFGPVHYQQIIPCRVILNIQNSIFCELLLPHYSLAYHRDELDEVF